MPIIATAALALGVLLAPLGTLIYIWTGMTDPDDQTMRISKALAVTGRWTATAGSLTYLTHAYGTGISTSPPMLTVLIIAAVAAVTTHVTKLRPPQTPQPI